MIRLMRDGTAEPVSRYQILRREREQGNINFPCSMYVCMYGPTSSKTMDQPGKVANPARGQLNRENGYFPVRVRA